MSHWYSVLPHVYDVSYEQLVKQPELEIENYWMFVGWNLVACLVHESNRPCKPRAKSGQKTHPFQLCDAVRQIWFRPE